MRSEEMDATTRHHACPDCHAAPGEPHLDGCPSDESDAAVRASERRDFAGALASARDTQDADVLADARALVPAGIQFRSKDDLWRHLTSAARERKGSGLLDSERQRLWRGCNLLWASGDVHETPAPRPSTSPARTVRAGAVA